MGPTISHRFDGPNQGYNTGKFGDFTVSQAVKPFAVGALMMIPDGLDGFRKVRVRLGDKKPAQVRMFVEKLSFIVRKRAIPVKNDIRYGKRSSNIRKKAVK